MCHHWHVNGSKNSTNVLGQFYEEEIMQFEIVLVFCVYARVISTHYEQSMFYGCVTHFDFVFSFLFVKF